MKEFNPNEFATLVATKEGLISSASDNSASYFISRIKTALVPFCLQHDVTSVVLAKLYELGHVLFIKRTLNGVTTYNFDLMPTIEFACRDALRKPMLRLYVEKIISKEQQNKGVDFTEEEHSTVFNYLLKSADVEKALDLKLGKLKGKTLKDYLNNALCGNDLPGSGLPGVPPQLDLSDVLNSKDNASTDTADSPTEVMVGDADTANSTPKIYRRPIAHARKSISAVDLADAITSDIKLFILLQVLIIAPLVTVTPLLTLPLSTAVAIIVLFLGVGNLVLAELLPWKTPKLVKGGGYHG
jgi:hypothetical protein